MTISTRLSWLVLPAVVLVVVVLLIVMRFRTDMERAQAHAAVGSELLQTRCGPIEFQQAGTGVPLLVVHGSGGGHDQGMAFAGPLAQHGIRVIAMSRFGYLRTPMPADGSAAAQADAHVCLLDALGIRRAAIVGGSAGALSALQPTTIVIDVTNATPEESQETAEALRARAVGYLDAPVCDWHENVRDHGGKVLCGGEPSAVSACRDIFAAFAHPFIYAGPSGAGTRMKLEMEKAKQ